MNTSTNLRWYDLTVISDEEELSRIKEKLEEKNVENLEIDEAKEVDLAYEIKERNTAYMGVFRFKIDSAGADELKEELDEDRKVLRFMLLRDKLREKEEDERQKGDKKEKEQSEENQASQKKKEEEKSLTNEDIEEKIEELQ